MVMFAKHPKVSEYDLSSVKKIVCGAAPLSAEIEEAVKNKLKLTNIQQGETLEFIQGLHLMKFENPISKFSVSESQPKNSSIFRK